MKALKNVIVRVTALLIFFAMITAVILYQAGVYDISFIKRPIPMTTEDVFGTEPGTDFITDVTTSELDTTPIGTETTITAEDAEKLLDLILSLDESKKAGWKTSGSIFGQNSSIARLSLDFGNIGKQFSFRKKKNEKKVIYQNNNGVYIVKNVISEVSSPAVRLYYGLIFFDDGEKISVRNSDGKVLIQDFKGSLVYAQSVSGRPVVSIKNKYYEIDYNRGLLNSIGKDKINFHAILYDYPLYYEKGGKTELYPFCEYVDVYTEITTEPEETPPEATDTDIGTDIITGETTETETDETTEVEINETTIADTDTAEAETSSDGETTETTAVTAEVFSLKKASEASAEGETESSEQNESEASTEADLGSSSESLEPTTDENGNVVIGDKIYSVETLLMWGYRDAKGNTVIEPQYKSVNYFSEGLAAVVDFEERISFIDKKGNVKITLNDKEIIEYYEESRTQSRQSYFEPLNFDIESLGMYYFDRGYVMVRYVLRGTVTNKIYLNENRLLGKDGKYFSIPKGYSLVNYSDGILLLEKNGKYGYMDLRGGWIAPPIYDSASPFVQGLAVLGDKVGKFGVINTEGEFVLPMYFDYISNASSGYISTYEEKRGWEIYCVIEK